MTLLPWKRPAAAQDTVAPVPAFAELALPLATSLYNMAHWLTRNPAEAEDLVQETFLKALRGFSGFSGGADARAGFKAWIFRILRNTYLTSRTGLAARRTVALEEELGEFGESYPEAAINRETPEVNLLRLTDRSAMQAAMEQLAPPLLEVILLCDLEEMKYKEIAVILEIPIGTVMSRIARARAALRMSLQSKAPNRSNATIRPAEFRV